MRKRSENGKKAAEAAFFDFGNIHLFAVYCHGNWYSIAEIVVNTAATLCSSTALASSDDATASPHSVALS